MSIKTPALLALAGTLLLGACSQQPTAPVAAAPTPSSPVTGSPAPRAAALGLYELHISAAGGKLSSGVTRVGGGKLSAQEISGLTFSAAAAENTSDASGKHYKVAITVNNGSGKDISQPLYVPVAVTGYSQNDTYFRNAKDSAGAESDPTGVTIEQADAATPLVTTSVSPSLISVPAGMTVSKVSDQAWQAPALANGASQSVTFGFNIPTTNSTYSFNVVFAVFDRTEFSDLIFSEYVEGSSNNKALELYNPTSDTIDLSAYSVELYANGATTPNNTQKLSGTLAAGGTLVLVNGQAGATLKALGTVSSVTNFNGDDALLLKKGTTIIDSFGQVGFDPGTSWTANGVTTVDKTLRRKAGITAGDTNATDAFDPSAQWEQFNIDTFDGLGTR